MICRPTGQPVGVQPGGNRDAGFQHRLASIVNGDAHAPGATSCPSIIGGRRTLGGEAGDRGGGREQHVDLGEERRHVLLELGGGAARRPACGTAGRRWPRSACGTSGVRSSARLGQCRSSSMSSHSVERAGATARCSPGR